MGIDCSCTIGWASDRFFAESLGMEGALTVDEFGEPPVDPFCAIHGDTFRRHSVLRRVLNRFRPTPTDTEGGK